MRQQVVVLKNKCLARVLALHALSQMEEVVAVGFVGLATSFKELNLFAAVGTYTDGAGQVVGKIFLLPLGKDDLQENGRLTMTRWPFLE